ncbi:MAG: hypothetical protein WED00_17700 [Aquisalimonadaceae bacterium]
MSEQPGRPGSEVERLRRELASSRQRLEDEVNYYRGQVESTRKRMEAEHVRQQASEVARRRQLEDDLAAVRARMHDAQQHGERLQRRYDELSEQYLRQEATSRDSVEGQIKRYKAAAQEAWRSAEEEVERMEREISEARSELEAERARGREVENSLRGLQGMERDSEFRQSELMEETAALKQALNLSERARVQSHRRAVQLGERLMKAQARLEELARQGKTADGSAAKTPDRPAKKFAGGAYRGVDNPSEVDLSKANAVLQAASDAGEAKSVEEEAAMAADPALNSMDFDFADEFMLIATDESLDRSKVARLREQVEEAEMRESSQRLDQKQAVREHELMRKHAPAVPSRPRPSQPQPAAPRPDYVSATSARQASIGKVAMVAAAVVVLAGAGAWFLGLTP